MVSSRITKLDWSGIKISAGEMHELQSFGATTEVWSLARTVAQWEQWVRELERGDLWVREELYAAQHCRADLEGLLIAGKHLAGMDDVLEHVKLLDKVYRAWTVELGDLTPEPTWWESRVPKRAVQRNYLDPDLS